MFKREGKLYQQIAGNKKNTAGNCFLPMVFLCCVLLTAATAIAHPLPDYAPYFTGGESGALTVCGNSGAASVNGLLAIVDSDAGQTETWTVAAAPANGVLSGFPAVMASTGGVITPIGLTYAPAAGFSGTDSFTITISDGIDSAQTTVFVTVHPTPTLSSTLTPPGICSGSVFSYMPASASAGATFTWHRAFTPGISNPMNDGASNPGETLNNVTNDDVTVTYVFTVAANGCSSSADVMLTVHPTPRLATPLNDTVCSGSTVSYVPVGTVPGTVFSWSRAVVAGIVPATPASGSGAINEVLTDTASDTLTTVYTFMLSANGCTSVRYLSVTVIPEPPVTSITTSSPASVCSGTLYQNFGAGIVPPAGMSYTWSAQNAAIWAVGNTTQYSLVNFPAAGNSSVILTISGGPAHCLIYDTFAVNVGSSVSASGIPVIYYNYQFVFQDNTQDSYQWGYDNAYTLDSALIPGAVFQSYPILSPDFIDNDYWVITSKNGCMQKTYFNGPSAVRNVNARNNFELKIAPNPASDVVNIMISGLQGNSAKVVLADITGRVLQTKTITGNNLQMDVSALPAGCYLVSCYENNIKIATSRFIKNQ